MQIDLNRIAAVAQTEKPEAKKDVGIKGKKKEELHELVKRQKLRVKGTGKNDSVLKKDLIRVLQRGSDASGETLDEQESRQKASDDEEATSKQKTKDDRGRRRHDKLAKKRRKPAFYQSLQNGGQPTEFDEDTRAKVKGRIPKATNGALIEAFARSAGIPKSAAKKFAGAYWRNMFQTLSEQGSVEVPGVGRLEKRWRKPRTGRNPQTGRPLRIAGRHAVRLDPNKLTRSMPSSGDIDRMIKRSGLKINFDKAAEMADIFQAVVEKGLRTHGKLPTGSFGKLEVAVRKATRGRDPRTGDWSLRPKSKKLKFKPSKTKFKTFFDEAEKDTTDRAQQAKDKERQEYLEGGIMNSLEDAMLDPEPTANGFIRDLQRGDYGDDLKDLTREEIMPAIKKFWPQALDKREAEKAARRKEKGIEGDIVGPDDLGEQGLEKAPREPLEDDIIEKAQQEDPGISPSPQELVQKPGGKTMSGDPEIDAIFRDAFGDRAEVEIRGLQLGTPPETIPNSGEVGAFDPEAELPKLEGGEDLIGADTPDKAKEGLKKNAKKKRQWLAKAWNGMTSAAKWGLTKVYARAMGGVDVVSAATTEGLPGASRSADFLHGLGLASLGTAAMWATFAASPPTAVIAAAAAATSLLAYQGGALMGSALGDSRKQRDIDLLGRDIAQREARLRAQGKDPNKDPKLDAMTKQIKGLKAGSKEDKMGARAQAKAQKRENRRKKLEAELAKLRDQEAKSKRKTIKSVDLSRIMSIAAGRPQTEAAVDLDRAQQIMDIIKGAPEDFGDRVTDVMAQKIAAMNRGEMKPTEFDTLAILKEAAA